MIKEIDASKDSALYIGYQGESLRTKVIFPTSCLTDDPSTGTFALFIRRNKDEQAFLVPTTMEEDKVIWMVRDTDTAYHGAGEVQLVFSVDGFIAKTKIWSIMIMKSLTISEDLPEPSADWVAEVLNAAESVEEATTRISELTNNIPTPPSTGTYVLRSVDGVMSWVAE